MVINKKELTAAIQKNYPYMDEKLCVFHAEKVLRETDERLWPDILLWMQGKAPDSQMIGNYCIDKILQIRGSQDFLSALDAMNTYLRDETLGEHMIWRTRR